MIQHRFRYLSLILIVVALLRFSQLGSKSLWFDEAFSARNAGKPGAQILNPNWLKPDPHPPANYLGYHYWMELIGKSESLFGCQCY